MGFYWSENRYKWVKKNCAFFPPPFLFVQVIEFLSRQPTGFVLKIVEFQHLLHPLLITIWKKGFITDHDYYSFGWKKNIFTVVDKSVSPPILHFLITYRLFGL